MAKINLNEYICDFDGKPIESGDPNHPKMRVGRTAELTLLNSPAREEGETKVKLALKIHDAIKDGDGIIDLKSEEITLLKEEIKNRYTALVSYQFNRIIDPEVEDAKAKKAKS